MPYLYNKTTIQNYLQVTPVINDIHSCYLLYVTLLYTEQLSLHAKIANHGFRNLIWILVTITSVVLSLAAAPFGWYSWASFERHWDCFMIQLGWRLPAVLCSEGNLFGLWNMLSFILSLLFLNNFMFFQRKAYWYQWHQMAAIVTVIHWQYRCTSS